MKSNKQRNSTKKFVLPENIYTRILKPDFYDEDTAVVARKLLGKILIKKIKGKWTGGEIIETEAYMGRDDPASHAARRRTRANEAMFGPVGCAYVYFIYGMYYCFNAVAYDTKSQPSGAVLIRALKPLINVDEMKKRRKKQHLKELTSGPGKLCQALNITRKENGIPLWKGKLLIIENRPPPDSEIVRNKRVGITKGTEQLLRFYVSNCPLVSRPG